MSKSENDKKKKDIEDMKKRIPELKKLAFENYYRVLLKQWLIPIGFVVIGSFIGLLVAPFVPLPSLSPKASDIQDIAKTVIAPSITTSGLFVTFVPVVSFFYIRELKEEQKEAMESLQEEKRRFTEEEDLKTVNSVYDLVHTFWYNLRIGVLKYVRTYLIVAIFTLFSITYLYIILSLVSAALFIVTDICLLVIILSGVLPIIKVALLKPARILVRYVISQEIVEKIEYED